MLARVLMALLLVLLVGCGKSAARTAASSAADQAQVDAVVNELTQAVRRYAVEQRRVPKALDELVANGYLAGIPSAPAGKKFAINKNLQVYLANQ
jgi:competence protein ComGC